MGSARDVVEISSDEEADSPVARRRLPAVSSLACLEKLFADRLVIGKLSAVVTAQTPKKGGSGGVGDDDDCVVLDSDPDGAATVADEKARGVRDGSLDELEIVAERGKVACRDFPHSRHLCSNLPFSTTSHTKHCTMCYCFVCDAPAPCINWGTGLWNDDHCHATDKEAEWKALREQFRCKSVPASHPENHQNVVRPTTTSPRQQDTQCQVSAPETHPSLIPSTSLFSVPRQNPRPSVARHSAVTVTPGRNVSGKQLLSHQEAEWKALREQFRCKSVPASHPENHQNVVRPTTTSPRQQDTQCQVSAPETHPSLIPSTSLFSVPRQNPRPSVARHSAVTVTPGRNVSAPRASPPTAGRGAAMWINHPELYQEEEDEEEYDDWEYADPPEEAKLYVGNLHYNIDSECLAELFEHAGIVEASKVIYERETYQSRGFGFVTMRYAEDADKAVKMFHRREAEGRVLIVRKAGRRSGARVERSLRQFGSSPSPGQFGSSPFRIYVGNLPRHVDDYRLNEFFSHYGRVVDANVMYDHTMCSRGFGFVTMLTREEMHFTVGLLHGKVFWGHTLRVEVAKEQRPRRGSY